MLDGAGRRRCTPSPSRKRGSQRRFGAEIGRVVLARVRGEARSTPGRRGRGSTQRVRTAGTTCAPRMRAVALPARAHRRRPAARRRCRRRRRRSASTPAFYARAVRNARFLRDRYTFLDLADDSGCPRPGVSVAMARKQRLTPAGAPRADPGAAPARGHRAHRDARQEFDVTTETARRDLDELAQSGALKRTYGGGASRSLIDEPGIGVRGRAHAAERARDRRAPRRRWWSRATR